MNIPISGVEIALFSAMLILWAAFLFGGFIFGKTHDDRKRRMPRQTRLSSSAVLVISGWLWFVVSLGTQINTLALAFAIGMTLGFIGDLFMANVFNMQQHHTLAGMGAFGIGHVAYIIGMFSAAFTLELSYPRWDILIIWWLIALVGWYAVVIHEHNLTTLHVAALPYALLLASTAAFAMGLAVQGGYLYLLLSIGAALFLLSDLIIAGELFNGWNFPYIHDIIWLTYGPGQMLIVFGIIIMASLNDFFGITAI